MIYSVILDGYYNAINGTPEYFNFIGAENFSPFLSFVHINDIPKVKNIFTTAKPEENSYLVIKFKNYKEIFKWVFLDIKIINGTNLDSRRIYVNLYTIDDFKNSIEQNNISTLRYRMLLDSVGDIYFEYTFKDQNIRFYWINKNQDIEIYNGKFFEWKNYMLSNNYIKNKNLSIFEKLCRDISMGTQKFSYKIMDSKIYADDENIYNIFKCRTIYLENKPYMVIGTLSENNNYYEKETLKDSLDTLTGLLSKEALTNYATELINKKPDFNINMVIVDIDNFKLINNNFGHHFGDEIIKAIADTLDEIVRDRGVIGRFEGDEFIIIFSGFNDNMELRSYLRTMRMTVEEKFKNIKNTVDLSISIGTARYPTDGISFDELFEKSDSCLYIAKQKGKNRYIIYDEVIDIKNIEKKNKKNILTIESREKNAQLACRVIDILMKNNRNNIEDTIKILGEELKLSRIAIFFGKELKRIALWGDKTKVYDNARYIYKGSYLTNFNINGVCVVHSSTSIEGKNPEVHSDYTEQNIYSAIQCLIYGDTGDIAGIISFERSFQRKSWTENEIYNFTLISHLIGELLKKEA